MLRTLAAEAARRFGHRMAFAAAAEPASSAGSRASPPAASAAAATAAAGAASPEAVAAAAPGTAPGPGGSPGPTAAGSAGLAAPPSAGAAEIWRLTFAELDRLSDEVAAGLAFRGALPGDVVALVLPSTPEFPACYLGVVKIGATVAGLDARWPPALLDQLINLLRPAVTVAPAGLAVSPGPDGELVRITPSRDGRAVLAGLRRAEPPPPPLPPDVARPIVIAFTAPAGRAPRGAVFGIRQLDAIRAAEAGDRWGSGVGWVVLTAVSCAHYSFMTRLPAMLQAGQSSVLLSSWRAGQVPPIAAATRASLITGLPGQLAELLALPPAEGGRADAPAGLTSVELVVSGGALLPPGLARSLRDRFGADVQIRYGCAEAGLGLSTSPDDPADEIDGYVGCPLPGVTVAVRAADGKDVPHGQTGEVLLRSAACMNGYWHDPAASAAAFTSDRFVRTGDYGRLDANGRLVLVGQVTPG